MPEHLSESKDMVWAVMGERGSLLDGSVLTDRLLVHVLSSTSAQIGIPVISSALLL